MSIQDPGRDLFHGIRITTENFEEVYVSSSYVESVNIVSTGLTEREYISVTIIFNSDFLHEKSEAMKRLQERKDITYIDILCKNEDKNIEIEVPYEDDEHGFNKWQSINSTPKGVTVLEISKKGRLLQ